jgi:hypothetical protein
MIRPPVKRRSRISSPAGPSASKRKANRRAGGSNKHTEEPQPSSAESERGGFAAATSRLYLFLLSSLLEGRKERSGGRHRRMTGATDARDYFCRDGASRRRTRPSARFRTGGVSHPPVRPRTGPARGGLMNNDRGRHAGSVACAPPPGVHHVAKRED